MELLTDHRVCTQSCKAARTAAISKLSRSFTKLQTFRWTITFFLRLLRAISVDTPGPSPFAPRSAALVGPRRGGAPDLLSLYCTQRRWWIHFEEKAGFFVDKRFVIGSHIACQRVLMQ